ncbi:MAG: nuclear transport factor 2 family protein [Nonomuraea sp.]|nr:nuclear transport factor 2 family protein [Nonomuraea sp.]
MDTMQLLADRVEIDALRGEFSDAAMTRDFDRLAELFTEDAVLRIPEAGIEVIGRAALRAGAERMQAQWEVFVQTIHPGTISLDGDAATGRTYVAELGRLRDGRSHQNYAIYHDRYRRTAGGWRFAERTYEVRYTDDSPLHGKGHRS